MPCMRLGGTTSAAARIAAQAPRSIAPCVLKVCTILLDHTTLRMQVGGKTSAADRIVGAHFFSPAHIMPLLEIVRTDKTSKQVGAAAFVYIVFSGHELAMYVLGDAGGTQSAGSSSMCPAFEAVNNHSLHRCDWGWL